MLITDGAPQQNGTGYYGEIRTAAGNLKKGADRTEENRQPSGHRVIPGNRWSYMSYAKLLLEHGIDFIRRIALPGFQGFHSLHQLGIKFSA